MLNDLIEERNKLMDKLDKLNKEISKIELSDDYYDVINNDYYDITKNNIKIFEKLKQFIRLQKELSDFEKELDYENPLCKGKCKKLDSYKEATEEVCPFGVLCGYFNDEDIEDELDKLLKEFGE